MNTIHMTTQDWAQYLQTYTPTNEQEAQKYANDLKAYATDNMSCIFVEAVLRRPELNGWAVLDNVYAKVKHDLAAYQQTIREGFNND